MLGNGKYIREKDYFLNGEINVVMCTWLWQNEIFQEAIRKYKQYDGSFINSSLGK